MYASGNSLELPYSHTVSDKDIERNLGIKRPSADLAFTQLGVQHIANYSFAFY
jgi:hypothetical protein